MLSSDNEQGAYESDEDLIEASIAQAETYVTEEWKEDFLKHVNSDLYSLYLDEGRGIGYVRRFNTVNLLVTH